MFEGRPSRAGVLVPALVVAVVLTGFKTYVEAQQRLPRVPRQGTAAIDAALSEPGEVPANRRREGAVLTRQVGVFTLVGDRVAFQPADQQDELLVLENLVLERVWKVFNETRERQWIVSGSVTEYQGRNYLLMRRAVVRALPESETASAAIGDPLAPQWGRRLGGPPGTRSGPEVRVGQR